LQASSLVPLWYLTTDNIGLHLSKLTNLGFIENRVKTYLPSVEKVTRTFYGSC
jgi:hypothetical protein